MAALLVKLFADKEIRRFQLDLESDGTVKYPKLANKVAQLYPNMAAVKLAWKDNEGDLVSITNDEELKEASKGESLLRVFLLSTHDDVPAENVATEKVVEAFRLEPASILSETVVEKAGPLKDGENKVEDLTLHAGVTCDNCNGEVKGLRYKCLVCHDYDLCETCKTNSIHSDHHTICIPSPNDMSWLPSFVSYRIPFFQPPHHRMRHRCCHKRVEGQQPTKGDEPGEKNPTVATENKDTLHAGITCDGCQGPVDGLRYKCLTCFNYDLCDSCQGKRVHPEHPILCIVSPSDGTWRRAFVHRRFLGGGIPPWAHSGRFRGHRMCNHGNRQQNENSATEEKLEETVQQSQEQLPEQNIGANVDAFDSVVAEIVNLLPMFMGPLSAINEAVQVEIRKEAEAKNVQSENLAEKQKEKLDACLTEIAAPTTVHIGVMCDACNNGPIDGMRFKCLVCPDYDLCESCESKHTHLEHPMVRIASPGDNSWRRMFQRYHHKRHDGGCYTKKPDTVQQQTDSTNEKETQPKDAQKATNPEEHAFNGFVDLMTAAIEAFGKGCSLQENDKKESKAGDRVEQEVEEKPAKVEEADAAKSVVEKSLELMLAMGFTNENGWLKELLAQKDGNICAVLDLFKPRR